MDNHEHLEELDPNPAAPSAAPPASAPAAAPMASPAQGTTASGQPYPQFLRFLAGGVIVLVGCLLPFGSKLTTTMVPPATLETKSSAAPSKTAGQELAESMKNNTPIPTATPSVERTLPAMMGIESFTGALWMLIALALISSMRQCIRDNKIRLKSVMLMLIPCGWAWVKLFEVVPSVSGFEWGTVFKIRMLEHLAQNVGSGFLLVLIGSTYVAINFVMAIVGAFTAGGKKAEGDPATAGTKSSARRR